MNSSDGRNAGSGPDDVQGRPLTVVPLQRLLTEIHPCAHQEAIVGRLEFFYTCAGLQRESNIGICLRTSILEEERKRIVVHFPFCLCFPEPAVEVLAEA